MPIDLMRRGWGWLTSQIRRTWDNLAGLVRGFAFDQILPSGIAGLLSELFALIPKALGRGSPRQQVYSSVTLIILAILSSPFTLGASLILAAPPAITLLIGVARSVPAFNNQFRNARGRKLRDRDIPLWRRD